MDYIISCQIIYCKKCYEKEINVDLMKSVESTYRFYLTLQKGFYPYKDMDSWQRFNETSLSDNKEFSSNLNMEDINDAEYGKSYIINLWLKLKLWIKINSWLELIDQPRTCRIFMLHWIKSVFIN